MQRVHGGAVSGLRRATLERNFEHSLLTAAHEKRRIGRAAAAIVKSNQAVILDVGTTTTARARALAARGDIENVVVITNALNIALEFERVIPCFTVIVTGGTLRPAQHSLVDPLADAVLDRVRADIAFIGCAGVDAGNGITNANVPEADMKRRMLEMAQDAVIVADGGKLGVAQFTRVVSISSVHTLVTGIESPVEELDELRDTGLEIIVA